MSPFKTLNNWGTLSRYQHWSQRPTHVLLSWRLSSDLACSYPFSYLAASVTAALSLPNRLYLTGWHGILRPHEEKYHPFNSQGWN
jgi:hypothetical protein